MVNDWKEVKLGDLIDIKHGYAFKGEFFSEEPTVNILITPGNFKIGGGFKEGRNKYYTGEIPREYILKEGDVIVTMTDLSKNGDTLGYSAIIPKSNNKCYLHNQRIGRLVFKSSAVDKYFLYWRMRSYEYQQFIVAGASGTTVKHTSPKNIAKYHFALPPLLEQKAIADTLSCLDDKIELNNKINKNLEAQAQAIFKSWFVDIEPFGDVGNDNWATCTLDEFCNIFTGRKNANAAVDDGKYKFFTCSPQAQQIDSYIFDGDAIIISGNGAYTGRTRFYNGKFDLYQRTYACTIANDVEKDYIFILYWFVKLQLSRTIKGGTHGSAIPYIVRNDIAKFEFNYNKKAFDKLSKQFKVITQIIQANDDENQKLSELRDTLLPKLMSGEIRVPVEVE